MQLRYKNKRQIPQKTQKKTEKLYHQNDSLKIRRTSSARILSVTSLGFFVVIIMFMLYIYASVSDMELKLSQAQERVDQQILINNDLRVSLKQREQVLERLIRAKLDYSYADEKIFVDSSKINNK